MKRRMSEREAWLDLAAAWRAAKRCEYDCCFTALVCGDDSVGGICEAIGVLTLRERITRAVERRMRARVEAKRKALGGDRGDYLWPDNEQGARERAAFCRRQAVLSNATRKAVRS